MLTTMRDEKRHKKEEALLCLAVPSGGCSSAAAWPRCALCGCSVIEQLRTMLMKLEIASAGVMAAQIPVGGVSVGQPDREKVVNAWFPFVAHPHFGRARRAADGDQIGDDPARGIRAVNEVSGHSRGFHVHAGAVVDVRIYKDDGRGRPR